MPCRMSWPRSLPVATTSSPGDARVGCHANRLGLDARRIGSLPNPLTVSLRISATRRMRRQDVTTGSDRGHT